MKKLLPILCLAFAFGCGYSVPPPKTYPANGKLLVNGQPVTKARVCFIPTNPATQQESAVEVDKQGNFKLSSYGTLGMPPGKYKVSVEPYSYATGKPVSENPIRIPKKYRTPETSDLFVEIKTEDNDLKLDLR